MKAQSEITGADLARSITERTRSAPSLASLPRGPLYRAWRKRQGWPEPSSFTTNWDRATGAVVKCGMSTRCQWRTSATTVGCGLRQSPLMTSRCSDSATAAELAPLTVHVLANQGRIMITARNIKRGES